MIKAEHRQNELLRIHHELHVVVLQFYFWYHDCACLKMIGRACRHEGHKGTLRMWSPSHCLLAMSVHDDGVLTGSESILVEIVQNIFCMMLAPLIVPQMRMSAKCLAMTCLLLAVPRTTLLVLLRWMGQRDALVEMAVVTVLLNDPICNDARKRTTIQLPILVCNARLQCQSMSKFQSQRRCNRCSWSTHNCCTCRCQAHNCCTCRCHVA